MPRPSPVATQALAAPPDSLLSARDFRGQRPSTVANTLGRLTQAGALRRVGRGLYYRPAVTILGPTAPNQQDLARAVLGVSVLHPAGLAAANLLGFSKQIPGVLDLTVAGRRPPRSPGLAGVRFHRRGATRTGLSAVTAAYLEVLRDLDHLSDLSPAATVQRLVDLLRTQAVPFAELLRAAAGEPPRVRAMLGAMGEHLQAPSADLAALQESLSPYSRYDFGPLATLPTAAKWGARLPRKARTR
ncbi:MAG: DUF6088 family protein [Candidatus Dormibacteria bacterium]